MCRCVICGDEFLSRSPDGKVCAKVHYRVCQVCGKEFEVNATQALAEKATCSEACRYALSTKHFLDNIDANVQAQQHTMLSRYGVANPMQVDVFKQKAKQTCLQKYGKESFVQTSAFIDKCIATNRIRYGVDWHAQTDEHKSAIIATCLKKYGVSNAGKVGQYIVDKMHEPAKLAELMKFRDDPCAYVAANFETTPTLLQLADMCGIRESSIGEILAKRGLQHLVKFSYSKMEDEIVDWLCEYLPSETIIRNTRKIITPYELDIYLPQYNIAIECNPTATHNSTTCIFDKDDEPKSMYYHQMKTDMCESKGIRLIHIFGYDWSNHKDTCKSMMLNAVNHTPTKLYARKLQLRQVSGRAAYEFLQTNHRQGGVHCKVRIGLYAGEELVSLMTFSKLRHTIGTGNDDTSTCWELVRFCNKNFTTVVGGASKLFKYFVKMFAPEEIRSFSDRAHTSGNLYKILGFTELRRSDPGYVWVDIKTDKAYSRYNSQKRNIQQFLGDSNINLSDTEVQIMKDHGFVQVFDSGTITWQIKSLNTLGGDIINEQLSN